MNQKDKVTLEMFDRKKNIWQDRSGGPLKKGDKGRTGGIMQKAFHY